MIPLIRSLTYWVNEAVLSNVWRNLLRHSKNTLCMPYLYKLRFFLYILYDFKIFMLTRLIICSDVKAPSKSENAVQSGSFGYDVRQTCSNTLNMLVRKYILSLRVFSLYRGMLSYRHLYFPTVFTNVMLIGSSSDRGMDEHE